jgi:L-asparaginase/Glu-tRNA(Gln) amidotransferase subunit D
MKSKHNKYELLSQMVHLRIIISNSKTLLCVIQFFASAKRTPFNMKKIVLVLLYMGWAGCFATAQNLPRVIILATGGTIAGQGMSSTSAGYTPGKLPIEDLLKNIPSIIR